MSTAPAAPIVLAGTIEALFARAQANRWGLAFEDFSAAVERAVAKRFVGSSPPVEAVEGFVGSLHADDLALACACAAGIPSAWDHFVLTYRPELYRAARAISDEATGRELADSLYADLFGLDAAHGQRRSLFRYYHGRARLSTWLRSVLAQRHVDLVRARRRVDSLDDAEHPEGHHLPASPAATPEREAAMRSAADAVTRGLGCIALEERTRLAYYYAHALTLAQIGRLFGESEATASRKLERARRALREAIVVELARCGMATSDVEDWAAVAREAWDTTLTEALAVDKPQEAAPPSFKGKRTP